MTRRAMLCAVIGLIVATPAFAQREQADRIRENGQRDANRGHDRGAREAEHAAREAERAKDKAEADRIEREYNKGNPPSGDRRPN